MLYHRHFFVLTDGGIGYERKYSFKKRILAALFLANRTDPSIYHNADTGSGEDALPDAYTGIIVWIYLRMAIWLAYWDYYTSFKRSVVRNAGNFPNAFCMAFELATYGLVAGILSEKMKKDIKSLYISLIAAMLCGRIVWGLVSAAVYAFTGGIFTWELFLMGGFINALPGILIQLVLIPALVERLYNMEGTVEWN